MSEPLESVPESDALVLDGNCGLCTKLAPFVGPRMQDRAAPPDTCAF